MLLNIVDIDGEIFMQLKHEVQGTLVFVVMRASVTNL